MEIMKISELRETNKELTKKEYKKQLSIFIDNYCDLINFMLIDAAKKRKTFLNTTYELITDNHDFTNDGQEIALTLQDKLIKAGYEALVDVENDNLNVSISWRDKES